MFLALALGVGQLCSQEAAEDPMLDLGPDVTFEGSVTVTGSLIPRKDLTALSPVTVLEVPTELTYSGIVRIEDLVTTMPQVFAGQNSTLAATATGTATIDLRFLGSRRTLVLINGRRMAFGDFVGADINAVPAPLVKRIDVLTGGASTVYGSDALAGVVNFVMDTDFTGVRGGLQYSLYQHDNNNEQAQQLNAEAGFPYPSGVVTDGDAVNGNVAVGGSFANGKGHAVAYIDYRKIESLTKSERDYLNCSMFAGQDGPYCGGSDATERGAFHVFHSNGMDYLGAYTLHLTEEGGDGHSLRPWTGERFNFGPYIHIQRPDEKWNAGAFANYEINEHFDVYLEVMYMSDYTDAQIAPSGEFGANNQLNCDNPMLSPQQHDIFCVQGGYANDEYATVYIRRRNVEGGSRTSQLGHTNSRLVAGLRGDINDSWRYDFYGLRAESLLQDSYINDLNTERMGYALDIIEDPNTGEWVCRNEQARADGCVPWNVFRQDSVTPEATEYISTVAVRYSKAESEVLNLTLTGDLENAGVTIPSASEALQLAVGAEHRRESLRESLDEVFQAGLAGGFGAYAINQDFSLSEIFVEILLPIVQDAKGAQDLSLELGYRYSDHSTAGDYDTYKAQMSWAVSPSWRLRGGYNRAVRAPSFAELFEPANDGGSGYSDPCEGANPTATFEECARTGVTADQYGNIPMAPPELAGSNALYGGNPQLTPELGDTYTAGLVWTPQSVRGLSVTLDYFKIEISDAIDTLTAHTVHRVCMETGDPTYCDLIHRDALGTIWIFLGLDDYGYTDLRNQNVGSVVSEGIDVNANYLIGLGGAGYLATDFMGTYLLNQNLSSPDFNYECAGYFGWSCGQPHSTWRHRFRATWESNFRLNLSLAWRLIGPADNDAGSSDPDMSDPYWYEIYQISGSDRIRTYNWFDLAASYTMRNGLKFTLGMNNILDEEPPLLPGMADHPFFNLYANYDPLGRYIFGSVQFNF
jgi:outer membrane receptor protein involved in Fe transport